MIGHTLIYYGMVAESDQPQKREPPPLHWVLHSSQSAPRFAGPAAQSSSGFGGLGLRDRGFRLEGLKFRYSSGSRVQGFRVSAFKVLGGFRFRRKGLVLRVKGFGADLA